MFDGIAFLCVSCVIHVVFVPMNFLTASPLLGAILAYVPLGMLILRPVLIHAFPLAGTTLSSALLTSYPAANSEPRHGRVAFALIRFTRSHAAAGMCESCGERTAIDNRNTRALFQKLKITTPQKRKYLSMCVCLTSKCMYMCVLYVYVCVYQRDTLSLSPFLSLSLCTSQSVLY